MREFVYKNLCGFKTNLFLGWDRLHGSDQGCPRKSDSWDVLQPASNNENFDGDLNNPMGHRQLSISSDSRLLEDEIKQEVKVILRPKRPPRPQSEVFLDQVDKRRTKRYSAFGVRPFLMLSDNLQSTSIYFWRLAFCERFFGVHVVYCVLHKDVFEGEKGEKLRRNLDKILFDLEAKTEKREN